MLKRFAMILVFLLAVTSVGTVFAAPVMTSGEKTLSDLIKGEQMLSNENEMTTAFKDQIVLLMYYKAINQIMMKMTPDQMKTASQSVMKTGVSAAQERYITSVAAPSAQQMESINKKLLDMNQDQLSSLLDKMISIMTKEQTKSMIKDNNMVGQLLQRG